ncbi:MAG: hypothetical protein R6U41_09285, partial [Desulfosalsimonas sp.]|uniref:hypothetical protein n=1 Tax=Desulfosalsimonas sp. TaxID=3073848 RepID=UPI003970FF91
AVLVFLENILANLLHGQEGHLAEIVKVFRWHGRVGQVRHGSGAGLFAWVFVLFYIRGPGLSIKNERSFYFSDKGHGQLSSGGGP